MRNTRATPAICIIDQLAMIVRNRFERIRYQPVPINGFLAQTGLSLEPEPRHRPWPSRSVPRHWDCRYAGFTREKAKSLRIACALVSSPASAMHFLLVGYPK